jgi:hypothetical protein
MATRERRQFTAEIKREAVKLAEQSKTSGLGHYVNLANLTPLCEHFSNTRPAWEIERNRYARRRCGRCRTMWGG